MTRIAALNDRFMTMTPFEQSLAAWRTRSGVPLAAGAMRIDGSLVWHGVAADGAWPGHARVRPRSRFPIYSITKTMTAVCVLRLEAAGLLDAGDRLDRWMPEVPVPRGITIGHLLRHTSGLPDYGPLQRYHEAVKRAPQRPWTDEEFIEATLGQGRLFEPGAGWAYSNLGYLFLRRIIERASGLSYRECVLRHIAAPLGLADTFVAETIADWESCVPGYGRELRPDGELVDVRSSYHPGWVAPGVAVSTVDDVTVFYDHLFNGDVLDEGRLARMLALTPLDGAQSGADPHGGMGILAIPDGPFGASYGHGGGGPGYLLFAAIIPRSVKGRLSVAVFCNSSEGADTEAGVRALCGLAIERCGVPRS